MPEASAVHLFGPFRLEPAERLLLRAGQPVPLPPKVFDLLVYLVDHAGRLVTKQELMNALWPATFVEEANLTYTVSALRKALADGPEHDPFIQTVPTRGYRFVARVTSPSPTDPPVSGPTVSRRPRRVTGAVIVAVLVAMLAAALALVRVGGKRTVVLAPSRFTIPLPDATLAAYATPLPQISPDGRRLAILIAPGSRIWLRNIPDDGARPLAGTEDARSMFWAPDSQHIAFTTSSALKTLGLSDGAVQILCDTCQPAGGGTWGRTGSIVFPSVSGSLVAIRATGGRANAITSLDRRAGETAHRVPNFLPDGRHFLYLVRNADATRSALHVGRLDSAERRVLVKGDTPGVFVAPGYLLFPQAGALMARPFDPVSVEFTGPAHPLLTSRVLENELAGQLTFSASDAGVLTHAIVERPLVQFQWVGRDGSPQQLVGDPGRYYTFDLSADGRRLVYAQLDSANAHLWVRDLDRGVSSRLTSGSVFHADPRWTDGPSVLATRWRPLPQAIVRVGPDGVETIIASTRIPIMVDDTGRDGRHALYREPDGQLLAMPLQDGSTAFRIRRAPSGIINQGSLSPDSRWVAYQEADEAGRFDVYVERFPPSRDRWQISSNGGVQPIWGQDGRELYYLSPDGTLNAVALRPDAQPPFSAPRALFTTGLRPPAPTIEEYAVHSARQRFLLLRPVEDRVRSQIGVILNWPALRPPSDPGAH